MARRYTPRGPQSAFNQGKGWTPPAKTYGAGWGTAQPANPGLVAGAAAQQAGSPNVTPGPNGWVPTPPGGVGVGGRPLDWQEQAYNLSANRNVALSNADATYQQGQAEQTYGYGASGAANPYSRAALLQESFQRSKLGTTNNYASGGQLNSGAYGRQQNENQHQYSISEDANKRAYAQTVYGINKGQAQTAANYAGGVDDEAFKALMRALGVG